MENSVLNKERKIKVVQIQYSTSSGGNSAFRLQTAFHNTSIESKIISLHNDDSWDKTGITYLGSAPKMVAQLDSNIQSFLTRKNVKQFGLFSYPVLGTNVANFEEIEQADVIYIHWALGGFFNFRSIRKLVKLNKPIIVIMHDMWPITGGCHYSFTCEKYVTVCNDCQMFQGQKKNDLSFKGFNKKLEIYSKFNNLYFVSPSQWLYDCAKKSFLLKDKPIFYIPNAIDNKLFKPFDKNVAKNILNIDVNDTVIAFGAMKVDNPYKGWSYLQKALEILKQKNNLKNVTILIFGSAHNKKMADEIPFKTYFMGRLSDDYSINLAYNAADVFVVPSLADNQPTTVVESMCCGTPVVGFNVGGIPDMISHKKNGYLAKYLDAEDVANGIKFCIDNKIKGKLLPVFERGTVVKKHIDLLNGILS
jgi:glycosyltransferase involved in cell wall biosynthesis